MKQLMYALLILISFFGYSQKVKLKKGEVLINDVVWLNYLDCGSFDQSCSLLNKNHDEIIFFKWVTISGAEARTPTNKDGNLIYVEVKFLGFNKLFEIQKSQKDIIAMLYNGRVVDEDGELDQEKAARMVEKYGTEFSNKYNLQKNTNQTIIIKEDRPGININLGR